MRRSFTRPWAITLSALVAFQTATYGSTLPVSKSVTSAVDSDPSQSAAARHSRPWSLRDIVEVSRITDIAVQGTSDETAYIVKQPSVAAGINHYRLFVVDLRHVRQPRELLSAGYLADVAWHPGTHNWSVRADLGSGVQLYEVSDDGRATAIVSIPTTAVVGGSDGLVPDSIEEPRLTGVLSYEWSPDGFRLWYSRLRIRESPAQLEIRDRSLRYDDVNMFTLTASDIDRSVELLGTELRVFDPATGSDRTIAFAPADQLGGGAAQVFRRRRGSANWVGPADIQYRLQGGAEGYLNSSLYRVNVETGATIRLVTPEPDQAFDSVPTPGGILTVTTEGSTRHLVDLSSDGRIIADYGSVGFSRVSGTLGAWSNPSGERRILGVRFDDRDGLIALAGKSRIADLSRIREHLSVCAFNSDLSFGACSRESTIAAPELISIQFFSGKIDVLTQPNSAYEEIDPLRTIPARWVNQCGYESTGYITYPRRYAPGQRYPTIVVTHGWDARNRFAWDGFQWEFPIQVFAERGYFVLSVNEPPVSNNVPAPYSAGAANIGKRSEQFREGYNPLATMEAAAMALIARGMTYPSMIGIAGYSRGASITRFAISHSAVFAAASSGEATWWDFGGYWGAGAFARNLYGNLFGGAPFDSPSIQSYLDFSASARTRYFAGPLLQQFTSSDAHDAVEMDQLLKNAHIPTELYIFPSESHLLWQPRHRVVAMEQNLDWFDFWLTKKMDPDPSKVEQYARWEKMAAQWRIATARQSPVTVIPREVCAH